jgi:hypothetical protein
MDRRTALLAVARDFKLDGTVAHRQFTNVVLAGCSQRTRWKSHCLVTNIPQIGRRLDLANKTSDGHLFIN